MRRRRCRRSRRGRGRHHQFRNYFQPHDIVLSAHGPPHQIHTVRVLDVKCARASSVSAIVHRRIPQDLYCFRACASRLAYTRMCCDEPPVHCRRIVFVEQLCDCAGGADRFRSD